MPGEEKWLARDSGLGPRLMSSICASLCGVPGLSALRGDAAPAKLTWGAARIRVRAKTQVYLMGVPPMYALHGFASRTSHHECLVRKDRSPASARALPWP